MYICSGRHCNTLQHTATHCNTLVLTCALFQIGNTLQHTTTHCNTMQHTATHCNTWQHTPTLQHIATHCNTLQYTAEILQHTATHCTSLGTLQHATTYVHHESHRTRIVAYSTLVQCHSRFTRYTRQRVHKLQKSRPRR